MIDAARRWKAWATAGCAEAPAQNHKLVLAQHQHGMAWQSRSNESGEKVLFRETEATKPMRRSGKESASRLRDGLELDAVVDQQATDYVPDGR